MTVKGAVNPRSGSSNEDEWIEDLAWYFTEFEGDCGFRSIGTSGAGESLLVKPSKEEADDKRDRIRSGLLLTLPGSAKADLRTVSSREADRGAVNSMMQGFYTRGARIWRRLTQLGYTTQQVLKRSYEERQRQPDQDWGPKPLSANEIHRAHREYRAL